LVVSLNLFDPFGIKLEFLLLKLICLLYVSKFFISVGDCNSILSKFKLDNSNIFSFSGKTIFEFLYY
jgi:hypothetical protein